MSPKIAAKALEILLNRRLSNKVQSWLSVEYPKLTPEELNTYVRLASEAENWVTSYVWDNMFLGKLENRLMSDHHDDLRKVISTSPYPWVSEDSSCKIMMSTFVSGIM